MKSFTFIIIIAFLFIAACNDLSSPYPAGKLCHSFIDDSLVGYWELVSVSDSTGSGLKVDSHLLAIIPFNRKEYLLQTLPLDDSGKVLFKDLGMFKGFISTIGKQSIANVQMLVPGEYDKNDYLIYPFCLTDDTLVMWGFSSQKVTKEFKSTCQLRKFLKKNLYNKSLYSSTRKYKKKYNKLLNLK